MCAQMVHIREPIVHNCAPIVHNHTHNCAQLCTNCAPIVHNCAQLCTIDAQRCVHSWCALPLPGGTRTPDFNTPANGAQLCAQMVHIRAPILHNCAPIVHDCARLVHNVACTVGALYVPGGPGLRTLTPRPMVHSCVHRWCTFMHQLCTIVHQLCTIGAQRWARAILCRMKSECLSREGLN